MEKLYAVTDPNNDGKFNDADFIGKTIKDTEIYDHFYNNKSKQALAIYVSQKIPVNEKYRLKDYSSAGNHCVIATGIENWNGGLCLVLDNTTGSKEDNYIPVDFPLFESLVKKIEDEYDPLPTNRLNNYGFGLAKKKFKKFKNTKNATDFKKENNKTEWFNMEKDGQLEHQMFFVKGKRPIYKLQFLQS